MRIRNRKKRTKKAKKKNGNSLDNITLRQAKYDGRHLGEVNANIKKKNFEPYLRQEQ